jgi:hypothetical protein
MIGFDDRLPPGIVSTDTAIPRAAIRASRRQAVRPWRLLTQDIRNQLERRIPMAERDQPQQPTHRAYSVIKREGQDDFWLNVGLAFPHKDGKDFNIILQAFPLDGKIVCREIGEDDEAGHGRREPERAASQKRRTRSSR